MPVPREDQVEVSMTDMAGRQIYQGFLPIISNKVTVNPKSFASGVYMVTIKIGEENQTFRLVRE